MKATLHLILTEGLNDCLNQMGYALKYAEFFNLEVIIYTNEAKVLFDFAKIFPLKPRYRHIFYADKQCQLGLLKDIEYRSRSNQLPPSKQNIVWREAGGGLKSMAVFKFIDVSGEILEKFSATKKYSLCLHIRSTDYQSDIGLIRHIQEKSNETFLLLSDNHELLRQHYGQSKIDCEPKDIGGGFGKPHHTSSFLKGKDRDLIDLLRLSFAECSISAPLKKTGVSLTERFSGYYLLSLVLKFSHPINVDKSAILKRLFTQLIGIIKYGGRHRSTLLKLNLYVFFYIMMARQ